MAVKIQVKRGKKAGLPTLAPGEYGLATDTGELFIGGPDGNIQVAVLGSDHKLPSDHLPAHRHGAGDITSGGHCRPPGQLRGNDRPDGGKLRSDDRSVVLCL